MLSLRNFNELHGSKILLPLRGKGRKENLDEH